MQGLFKTVVAVAASVGMALCGFSGAAQARTISAGVHSGMTKSAMRSATRRSRIHAAAAQAAASTEAEIVTISIDFRLKLQNLHTGESLDIVYRVGDTYLPEAVEKLNYFLRDHNTQEVTDYDPKEFDVLHNVLARLRRPNSIIDIVCGYRTPETNAALRQNSARTGVAEHSQHMEVLQEPDAPAGFITLDSIGGIKPDRKAEVVQSIEETVSGD